MAAALGIMLGAGTGIASAATITLTLDSNWADYHTYAYTDVNGIARTATTGAYMATLSGGGLSGTPTAYVFCNDFNIDTAIGSPIAGYMERPTSQIDLEEAYLMYKVAQSDPAGHGYTADIQNTSGPVSMAIWLLQNPSSYNSTPFPVDKTSAALIAEAQNAILTGSFTAASASSMYIWIPNDTSTSQRFGVMYISTSVSTSSLTTPEPSTMMMFGAGALLILAGSIKRKTRLQ